MADSWQGRGLGTLLFERLARRARDVGIDRFVADTLAHNRPMLAVFHHAGLPVTDHLEAGVADVVIDLVIDLGGAREAGSDGMAGKSVATTGNDRKRRMGPSEEGPTGVVESI